MCKWSPRHEGSLEKLSLHDFPWSSWISHPATAQHSGICMCGESTRPGEAVPGWDVSAVGRKTTWPRGMTAVLLWTLYSMNSTCGDVHGEGETEKTGYAGSKIRWRGVRHGDALQTNESFAMRRQGLEELHKHELHAKSKKRRSSESAKTPSFQEAQAFQSWVFMTFSVLEWFSTSTAAMCLGVAPCCWAKARSSTLSYLFLRYLSSIKLSIPEMIYLVKATQIHIDKLTSHHNSSAQSLWIIMTHGIIKDWTSRTTEPLSPASCAFRKMFPSRSQWKTSYEFICRVM